MRHIERCVFWKAPASRNDHENSLTDAYVSLPPGKMLVYRMGPPTGTMPAPINATAAKVAARLRGSLVQWPDRAAGDGGQRSWLCAIQKPGLTVEQDMGAAG